jgi:hypothetical protein
MCPNWGLSTVIAIMPGWLLWQERTWPCNWVTFQHQRSPRRHLSSEQLDLWPERVSSGWGSCIGYSPGDEHRKAGKSVIVISKKKKKKKHPNIQNTSSNRLRFKRRQKQTSTRFQKFAEYGNVIFRFCFLNTGMIGWSKWTCDIVFGRMTRGC